ncbi:MAG: hypothetical protein ACKVS8_01125 [Phycisphaerales bacterium]
MDAVGQLRAAQELINAGRPGEAIAALERLTRAHAAWAPAWQLLAIALHGVGRAGEALPAARRACEVDGASASCMNTLAGLLVETGHGAEAAGVFERLLTLNPADDLALFNLSNLEWTRGGYMRSIDLLRRAQAGRPDDRDVIFQLASSLCAVGRVAESLEVCEKFLARSPRGAGDGPDAMVLGARAFAMLGSSAVSAERLAAVHRELGVANERGIVPMPVASGAGHGGRAGPIRIGFVSPDLREHPVARFLLPLLCHVDRARFTVFVYSCSAQTDATTAELRSAVERGGGGGVAGAGAWRDVTLLGDDEAAALVRADNIDVLVDLAGNTVGSRPGLLARCAAPVQVSYLGYPATTGMKSVGFRLVDAHTDPLATSPVSSGGPGVYDAQCTEHLVRVPDCFVCYRPPAAAPPARAAEAGEGPVRFGCFGSLHKHSDACLAAWGKTLARVPGSMLVLKSMMLSDERVAMDVRERLAAAGIDVARVRTLTPTASVSDHLRAYHDVDIALDTFPYHGTTTTCDALYMGVPVVSMAGASHHARVGVSLLRAVGLSELVARDEAEYVEVAVALAHAAARRAVLHAALRERVEGSPLRDEAGFAKRWGEAVSRLV